MHRRTFLSSLAAFAVSPRLIAMGSTEAGRLQLRVLSYNIHHGQGMDGKLDLARIATLIANCKPDLVALQEVDRSTNRTQKVDQVTKLSELTGMNSAFGLAMQYDGGEYGNAILSRHPIAESAAHALPGSPKEEPRCLLLATIKHVNGQLFRFGSTHLNHRNKDERLAQARRIIELAPTAGAQAGPVLIAGDFNATPNAPEIRLLTDAFTDVTAKALPEPAELLTSPADTPRAKIDYILAGPTSRWKATHVEVIAEKVASDHRPIFAVVEWS